LDKFEILPAFSKPIAWVDLKLSDEFYKNIDIAFDQSNIEMVHNDGAGSTFGLSKDMHVLNNPVLKDFKKIILNTVKNYWHNELLIKNDFSITTSWFTLLTNGTKGDWHSHANNFLSGVFYFGDYFSELKFRNLNIGNSFECTLHDYNIFNSKEWILKPKKGLLILFPSELNHSIIKADKERKSMAFNMVPVGDYGTNDSRVNMKYEK